MNDELSPCALCKGYVMELVRNYEESIIECQKCNTIWDIATLWNQLTTTQQTFDTVVEAAYKLLPLAKKTITGSYLDDVKGGFKEFTESSRQVILVVEAALANIKD